jgi:hypothetical protein
MAERKASPSPRAADDQRTAEARAAHERTAAPVSDPALKTADGGKGAGPKSALKGGVGADGEHFASGDQTKKLQYSVQVHTDEKGLEVMEPIEAESGDEAAKIALEKKNYRGASVRGVQPYSDPDPNSLGGERDAVNMIRNANNGGAIINTLGTEANAEAVEKLGKADIAELGE